MSLFSVYSCQKESSIVYYGPYAIDFVGEESSYVIEFTSRSRWRIVGSEPWVSFSPSSGSGSESPINVTVHCDNNTTYEKRECTFTISDSGMKQRVLVTQADNEGVLAIDIGSHVLWASCNLGASKPWEYGNYYAWGEIEPKYDYIWDTYKWFKNQIIIKYTIGDSSDYIDNKTVLDSDDDAAKAELGGKWSIPTMEDFEALFATKNNPKYKWELKTKHGHMGWEITYLKNGNSLFFPLPGEKIDHTVLERENWGYYWSSTLVDFDYPKSRHAWLGIFDREVGTHIGGLDRAYGFPVRAILK